VALKNAPLGDVLMEFVNLSATKVKWIITRVVDLHSGDKKPWERIVVFHKKVRLKQPACPTLIGFAAKFHKSP
jgi:hypothetical protein